MYLIDTRKYDDSFFLAKILEKVNFTDEETKKIFKHFEKPTVDAVEVVRCKDCIHYWNRNGVCDAHIDLIDVDDDCYCSWGERKDRGDR